MAIIPTLAGFIAGERPTATKLTLHTKTAFEASVYYKPFCRITNTSTQSFSSTSSQSSTLCVMNSILQDNDSMADLVNGRIVIQTAGFYQLSAQAAWASNATGYRMAQIQVNGGIVAAVNVQAANGISTRLHPLGYERLNAGDAVTLAMAQNSGAVIISDGGYRGCWLAAEWTGL